MNLQPAIITTSQKHFIGMHLEMSLANNQTFSVFRTFMPRRNEVAQRVDDKVVDIRVYPTDYYAAFSPMKPFIKWAAVEVNAIENIPTGMESITLEGGKYAVFTYKSNGNPSAVFNYIFREWLPHSGYNLAERPHFDRMFEHARLSEVPLDEEIWIPITEK
ncbi:MAG: GyrI-like domain-containing protein [Saprospiraceae bacterium]